MADIVLINPRFEVSYWGLEHALPLLGKKCNIPTACLPLLAALTPAGHSVTIVDENVEPIDYDRLAQADIVGLTGMTVQRARMLEILRELKTHDVFTIVGGPWVTVQEDYFDGLADAIFIGEAETTWPQFLEEWAAGRHQYRYEQAEPTDMTKVPVPRYDLLKTKEYLFGSVQFSRGCPFQCEFCDIIVTFGRRPRLKTSAQVIAELEAMRKQHLKMAFIVDDNLIGNKMAVKELLRDLIAWQTAEGYPFTFFTEASLNLAEDEELIQLMDAANIVTVFIGIESPNEESLRETKKYQNVKKAASIVDRVRKVQDAGIEVWCGMIVGFDHDDTRIFKAQHEFLRQTDIMHAMVGMLSAIPKTPLHARLKTEGRLDLDDEQPFGTNVIPLGMTRERVARRVRRPDARTLRSRLLLRAARKSLPHKEIRLGPNPQCLLAQTPVAEAEVAIRRCRAGDRAVPAADEKRTRPGIASDLSPSDGHHGPSTARPEPVIHLRDQMRNALPPLHNVSPDGRTTAGW